MTLHESKVIRSRDPCCLNTFFSSDKSLPHAVAGLREFFSGLVVAPIKYSHRILTSLCTVSFITPHSLSIHSPIIWLLCRYPSDHSCHSNPLFILVSRSASDNSRDQFGGHCATSRERFIWKCCVCTRTTASSRTISVERGAGGIVRENTTLKLGKAWSKEFTWSDFSKSQNVVNGALL